MELWLCGLGDGHGGDLKTVLGGKGKGSDGSKRFSWVFVGCLVFSINEYCKRINRYSIVKRGFRRQID